MQRRPLAALAQSGQIGAAADQIGISPLAASRLLGQLDAMVGTAHIPRHPRGITLTEAERIRIDRSVTTLKSMDHGSQSIDWLPGHARIGSVTGPALDLLPPTLR